MPVNNLEDVRGTSDRSVPGPGGAIPVRIYYPHGEPVVGTPQSFSITAADSCSATSNLTMDSAGPWPAAPRPSWCRSVTDWHPNIPRPRPRWMHSRRSAGWSNTQPSWVSTRSASRSPVIAPAAISPQSPRSSAVSAAVTQPAAQLLLYPVIDPSFETDSYRRYGTGYFNTRASMQWYWSQYLSGETVFDPPYSGCPSPGGLPCGPGARSDRNRRFGSPAQRGDATTRADCATRACPSCTGIFPDCSTVS